MGEALVVLSTIGKIEDGESLANLLVERRLAACVQIMPPIKSVYRWQGKIEQSNEVLLIIKTDRRNYVALEAAIKENHPYETPEIVALSVEMGSKEYLDWIEASTY